MDVTVINAETFAVSEYDSFKYNSFFELGGKQYGVADDGIHLLEGDDDNGAEIQARAVTGRQLLGSSKEKRVPAVFPKYWAADSLALLTVTTHNGTARIERWYSVPSTDEQVPVQRKLRTGRGVKDVYWEVGVENRNGADFRLDALQLHVDHLSREA